MAEGGYAAVARALTGRFGIEPPMDRRQVSTWSKRRTLNRAGQPFPEPVREDPGAVSRHEPRWVFDIEQAASWYEGGVPGRYGVGWRELAIR